MFEEVLDTIRERTALLSGRIIIKDISPKRNWSIALVFATLLTVGFIFFSAYLFIQINDRSGINAFREDSTIPTINRSLLNEVLEFYREKERNLEVLKESAPTIVDPSL